MSVGAAPDGAARQEVIIVRRGGYDEDEAHHGGVWKIAFADFMTAMMCFFLVMWLINAANEQTRAALASYFNPVKLIDRSTSRKGLDEPGKVPGTPDPAQGKQDRSTDKEVGFRDAQTGPSKERNSVDTADDKKHSDRNLFADPYAVLAEIAGETGALQNTSALGDGGAGAAGPATGASGGQNYRDPFAPDFWSQQVELSRNAPETARADPAVKPGTPPGPAPDAKASDGDKAEAGKAEKAAADGNAADATPAPAAPPPAAREAAPETAEAPGATPAGKAERAAAGQAATEAEKPKTPPAEKAGPDPATRQAAAEIGRELAEKFGADEALYRGLSVSADENGVRVSLSDQLNYGMFEIGSAVPKRELVLAMEKIAAILAGHKGTIVINGHTDARPFRSENYDNWRLSAARAQSAYYMLVRAGLDEKRVQEVAGFADRKLKVADDPYAAANRRIEILLEPAR